MTPAAVRPWRAHDVGLLTVRGDRVTQIWVLADQLQRLAQIGALPA